MIRCISRLVIRRRSHPRRNREPMPCPSGMKLLTTIPHVQPRGAKTTCRLVRLPCPPYRSNRDRSRPVCFHCMRWRTIPRNTINHPCRSGTAESNRKRVGQGSCPASTSTTDGHVEFSRMELGWHRLGHVLLPDQWESTVLRYVTAHRSCPPLLFYRFLSTNVLTCEEGSAF